jgi:hypothetical protein
LGLYHPQNHILFNCVNHKDLNNKLTSPRKEKEGTAFPLPPQASSEDEVTGVAGTGRHLQGTLGTCESFTMPSPASTSSDQFHSHVF